MHISQEKKRKIPISPKARETSLRQNECARRVGNSGVFTQSLAGCRSVRVYVKLELYFYFLFREKVVFDTVSSSLRHVDDDSL